MKKIMFNDRFGLTQAVLDGRKTMTRRFEKGLENLEEGNFSFNKNKCEVKLYGEKGSVIEVIKSRYKIGEVVAVKQSYKDAGLSEDTLIYHADKDHGGYRMVKAVNEKGWSNKMFVAANLMPHHIRITDIKVERLQEISEEDCMREGIRPYNGSMIPQGTVRYVGSSIDIIPPYGFDDYKLRIFHNYYTPKEAYSELIGRIEGKGTWKRNPWVFVYEFELVN